MTGEPQIQEIDCQADALTRTAMNGTAETVWYLQSDHDAMLAVGPDLELSAPVLTGIYIAEGSCNSLELFEVNTGEELEIQDLLPDTTICLGASIAFDLSEEIPDGATITWSPAESLTSSSVPDPIASPVETTVSRITVEAPDFCTTTAAVEVEVVEFSYLMITTDQADVCSGETITL